MKVLVLGSGAKDNAITWWFSKSKLIEGLYMAPGNPGVTSFAINLPKVDPADGAQVLAACKEYGIDFVFCGTEAPLLTGVIDLLNENGISTFGAPSYAIKIETDRKFSREFAQRHGIPMPASKVFESEKEIAAFLKANSGKTFTIKPNGNSPSRVMISSDDYDALYSYACNLLKKGPVLIEDHLTGIPITMSILCDDKGYLRLPICSEYTKREHADKGYGVPTGGMGAVCPIAISPETHDKVSNLIIRPTFRSLREEGLFYKGVLTFSIMITKEGPVLLDYHVRLNDPATQAIVSVINNDLVELMTDMKNNNLDSQKLDLTGKSAVAVVVASEGYPENTEVGAKLGYVPAKIMGNKLDEGHYVFFGAVESRNGSMYTTGGRAATIVGTGVNVLAANEAAYNAIDDVTFDGSWYRDDIGTKFFETAIG